MYIEVKLLNNFNKLLTYAIPESWPQKPIIGSIVTVPLKSTEQLAMVQKILVKKPNAKFEIRDALELEVLPDDKNYFTYLEKLAGYYNLEPINFLMRLKSFIHTNSEEIDARISTEELEIKNQLSEEQQKIYESLVCDVIENKFSASLIYGVTGSGKSEIYKKLIEAAISQDKSAIFILPEVSLALEFERKFRAYFGNSIDIFSFHSGTSQKDKKQLWNFLLNNRPVLIVGVHQPVFLPIFNLGLIIVDEEHETGYQEKKHPRINSKEAALIRAKEYGIPIILGSATPSLTSFYNVEMGRWKLFELRERFRGKFSEIKVVELLKDKVGRKNFWISSELEKAIHLRLLKKEQVIIFLNRRGFSFFIQCEDCGAISSCKNCDVSLTLHSDNMLRCHYCEYFCGMPELCSECSSVKFLKKGLGTQQVVSILEKLYLGAKIGRMDLDVSANKKKSQQLIQDFESNQIDILVGTQSVTKGYNFPNVTLVGVIWGDLDLSLPIYNAYETTVQKLIQVAGRAGRFDKPGQVIVQVLSQNSNLDKYVHEKDYISFIKKELKQREIFEYPPYVRLFELEVRNTSEASLNKDVLKIVEVLNSCDEIFNLLGPVNPPVSRVNKVYRKIFYIKVSDYRIMNKIYSKISAEKISSLFFMTVNPL